MSDRPDASPRRFAPRSWYARWGKPLIDRTAAMAALILASPLLLILIVVLLLVQGRPLLFTQVRPGFREQLFTILKFRTMTDARAADGTLLSDAQRLTPAGRWLRATSLDELPQLINVLRGDLSFVGPRPLLVEYLPLYSEVQRRRHLVRPGLTGLAQVNGRNALDWTQRLRLDVEYAERLSFALDLRIMFMTLGRVLGGRGVAADGHATVPRFTGSPD